ADLLPHSAERIGQRIDFRPMALLGRKWTSASRGQLGQGYLAGLIDLRLLFNLSHRPDVRDPWLRGARPHLHLRRDLIALTNCAYSNGVNLGSCSGCRRINWRSTFRAERLWPFIPAFAGLHVDFQFARK